MHFSKLLSILAASSMTGSALAQGTACPETQTLCSPAGVTASNPPAVGPELSTLYADLLESVAGIHFKRAVAPGSGPSVCCANGVSCVALSGFAVPFCYDKFTTNYQFADGSYGNLSTGEFHGADGSVANLVTGSFIAANGANGDIYADKPQDKPNMSTVSVPPVFTASGVGSAIPPTALGSAPSTIVRTLSLNSVSPTTTSTVTSTATSTSTTSPSSTSTASQLSSGFSISQMTSMSDITMFLPTHLPVPTGSYAHSPCNTTSTGATGTLSVGVPTSPAPIYPPISAAVPQLTVLGSMQIICVMAASVILFF